MNGSSADVKASFLQANPHFETTRILDALRDDEYRRLDEQGQVYLDDKMFGHPTGVGCLLARRDALARLRRPWFAGGTITVATVQADAYQLAEGSAGFEDDTLNYLSLPAIKIGAEIMRLQSGQRPSQANNPF
jgi:hypothetical protein